VLGVEVPPELPPLGGALVDGAGEVVAPEEPVPLDVLEEDSPLLGLLDAAEPSLFAAPGFADE